MQEDLVVNPACEVGVFRVRVPVLTREYGYPWAIIAF
jgi:hypothetical protein